MVRIETAQPLPGYRLQVRFNDGLAGVYPVEPERRGGVFLGLLEVKTFNAVTINPDFDCVEWPGGIDLCPHTMHQIMSGSVAEADRTAPLVLCEDGEKGNDGSLPPG